MVGALKVKTATRYAPSKSPLSIKSDEMEFPVSDGYTVLQVISSTQLPITVPYFTPAGYAQNRKYGDINWEHRYFRCDIDS